LLRQKLDYSSKMEFEIYALPKMPNTLLKRHWRTVSNESKKWHSLVRSKLHWIHEPLPKAKLTLTRYSVKEPDFDGLVGSFKYCIDALVKCGVLIDDKYSVIGESKYRWQKVSKLKEQKIRVQIEF
jgi:Holliday junction resolvase RusA-like endonuclease